MTNPRPLRIYRPLSPESRQDVTLDFTSLNEFFRGSISPRISDKSGTTLINGGEVVDILRKVAKKPAALKSRYRAISQALQQHGQEPIAAEITDIRWFQSTITNNYATLAIILGGISGKLEEERSAFAQLFPEKRTWRTKDAHLTLARVSLLHATSDVMRWAKDQIPSTISLLPAISDPLLPQLAAPETQGEIPDLSSKAPSYDDIEIRTIERQVINTSGIPEALLRIPVN